MSTSVKMRQEVERKISEALIKQAIAAGYSIVVDNGNELTEKSTNVEKILEDMFSVSEEHLIFYKENKKVGWVYLVYGNEGWDVICDYTSKLEHIMTDASKLSDYYAG